MIISVKLTPNASAAKVHRLNDTHFTVSVTEPPVKGRANHALILAMADYLGIKPYRISLIRGIASRTKILEIEEN